MTPTSSDAAMLLPAILDGALKRTWRKINDDADLTDKGGRKWSERVRDHWVSSLRASFSEHCASEPGKADVVAYGGKPANKEERKLGLSSGIKAWKRWEFMYDVTVLRVDQIHAAYAKDKAEDRQIDVVRKAIWLVESEVGTNGRQVAIDISKLHLGLSDHKLLIAAHSAQLDPDKWGSFLGHAMKGMQGEVFLAMLPTYSSRREKSNFMIQWQEQRVKIELYRCIWDGSLERLGGEIGG